MKNPGRSSILDPVLEEWMVRKRCINWAKVQVQRIKPCSLLPWYKPQWGQSSRIATATSAHHQADLYFGFFLPSFQLLVTGGCDRRCQLGQVACCGLGMGAGRQGHQSLGSAVGRWAAARGLRREHFLPLCQKTLTLGISGVCNGVVWKLIRPAARKAYVPVFKYRFKLAKSPVLGRGAERSSLPASLRRAAGMRKGPCRWCHPASRGRRGVRWHRTAFVCGVPRSRSRWRCCGGVRGRAGAAGGGGAAGQVSPWPPASRRQHGAGVWLSCAESPLKICSSVSYWVLFLSPVPLSPWSSVVALN